MVRCESRSGTIGHITLDTKQTGAPSAGNPHAGCEVAGAGNGFTVWLLRHSQRKWGATARLNLRNTAPVLDPTRLRQGFSIVGRAVRSQPRCRLAGNNGSRKWLPDCAPGRVINEVSQPSAEYNVCLDIRYSAANAVFFSPASTTLTARGNVAGEVMPSTRPESRNLPARRLIRASAN